jgi:carbon-monoxide dehydrogenase small subunit
MVQKLQDPPPVTDVKTLRRKREILEAASRVFRRRGLHATGMREIAAELEMHVGNLYYYFRNKEDLLAFCQEDALAGLLDLAGHVRATGLRADAKLCRLIIGHVVRVNEETPGALAHLEVDALTGDRRQKVLDQRDAYEAAYRKIITDGVEWPSWVPSTGPSNGTGRTAGGAARRSAESLPICWCADCWHPVSSSPRSPPMAERTTTLELLINGESRVVAFPTHHTLLEVLREECGLTGTKHGCELGECGTCAVLVDGQPVLSCLVLAAQMSGREIETVEGLQEGNRLHPLQQTFADLNAAQCGYCTPGILMTAKALLADNAHPTRDDIREALSGTLCRCTGYHKILQAVEGAAQLAAGEEWTPAADSQHGATPPDRGSE